MKNTDFKIGDRIMLLKNDNNNGTKTPKNSVGKIVKIPSFRTDVIDVDIDGLGFRCLCVSDIKNIN